MFRKFFLYDLRDALFSPDSLCPPDWTDLRALFGHPEPVGMHDLEDRAAELNQAAAELACTEADSAANPTNPSINPS